MLAQRLSARAVEPSTGAEDKHQLPVLDVLPPRLFECAMELHSVLGAPHGEDLEMVLPRGVWLEEPPPIHASG
jgi:hypothetical protein